MKSTRTHIKSGSNQAAALFRRAVLVSTSLTLIMLSGACVETIDFDVDRAGNGLVVDGMITDSPGPYTLKLRRTPYTEKISDPLGGATVTISDNLGNREEYFETTEGTYLLAGSRVKGERGRTYQIEIVLPNGFTYRSEPETMPSATARDSLYYEFDRIETFSSSGVKIDQEVLRVHKETVVPETDPPLYLKWDLQEAYKFTEYDFPDPFGYPPPVCYITDQPDPQSIHLYDGGELTAGPLKPKVMVERELDYAFYTRYYMNLIQYSITPEAHEYWQQVDQAVNQTGTIFDVPPANAGSNIYNVNDPDEPVFGYFQAAAVDTTRFFVTRNDLPVFINEPCRFPNRPNCTGCLKIDNSSSEPPFYWLQD